MEKLALIICSGLGSGFAPKAPGTVGSLLIVLVVGLASPPLWVMVALFFIVTIVGILLTPFVERTHGKDPGVIVIDEWSGQLLALCLFIPGSVSWITLSAAFVLFRLLDIWKPLGIDNLQKLPGGWGVMLDDVLAGLYVNIILHAYLIFL